MKSVGFKDTNNPHAIPRSQMGMDVTYNHGDGISHINIATTAKTPLGRLLGYYDVGPKIDCDGHEFFMYAGLYYYLITQGDNLRFLRATSRQELEAKRKYAWENVPGLASHLEGVLSLNLQRSPMGIPLLMQTRLPIVWEEPDRDLRNAEKRWLRVVQSTVHRLRNQYLEA